MKKIYKGIISFGFISVVSASTLYSQPYTIDENGNGLSTSPLLGSFSLPSGVVVDPTGGITNSPVLVYSLDFLVFGGDVALLNPDGTTIDALLRFFVPAGQTTSDVIFYCQPNGTLAGSGIPDSPRATLVSETGQETTWLPAPGQPGSSMSFSPPPIGETFEYNIITEVPEPATGALLWVAAGVWLTAWGCRRRGFFCSKVRLELN